MCDVGIESAYLTLQKMRDASDIDDSSITLAIASGCGALVIFFSHLLLICSRWSESKMQKKWTCLHLIGMTV